jgi:hypothetical protein
MRSHYVHAISIFAVLGLACNTNQSSEGASASSAPAATTKASTGCPEGAYVDETLKFCIVLPEGFKPTPAEDKSYGRIQVGFEKDAFSAPFSVTLEKEITQEKANEVMAGMARPSDDGQKKEPGKEGDTQWVHTHFANSSIQQFDLYTPGREGMLSCYVNASDEAPVLIKACKTLRRL